MSTVLNEIIARLKQQKSCNINGSIINLNGTTYKFQDEYVIVSGKDYVNLSTGTIIKF